MLAGLIGNRLPPQRPSGTLRLDAEEPRVQRLFSALPAAACLLAAACGPPDNEVHGVDNLCASLQQFPDYFKDGGAPETHASLAMMAAAEILGNFFLAAPNAQVDVSYLAAFKGGPVMLLPGVDGDLSLVEFNPSGNARGSGPPRTSRATADRQAPASPSGRELETR
jgi:hypothetical protein